MTADNTTPMATPRTALGELHQDALMWRYERSLPHDLAAYADELVAGAWFRVSVKARPHELRAALAEAFTAAAIPERPERARLADDITALAELLAHVLGCETVAIRLEHDPGATCPVFHQDQNVMRLLCTYAGAGTEWLPEAHVDRAELGLRGRSPEAANQAIARGEPEHARTGEVLLMQGARSNAGHAGLVHKSPAGDLGPRLLLAIDAADGASGAEWTTSTATLRPPIFAP
ncbi:MAG: DUF1826 domain-containing protein [Desertimonas sp.]